MAPRQEDFVFAERALQHGYATEEQVQECLALLDRLRAALTIGLYELRHSLEVPYRVAISEAVSLAKDFGVASMNSLATMSLELTDATGSGADIVRVKISRAGEGARS